MDIQFIDPVPTVLEEVKNATGKGIEFIAKEDLTTYAALKMARKDMPSHLIYYKNEHDEIINHLIVHECGHIFRIFKCPENQRLMPYSDPQMKYNALKTIENEIMALTDSLSEDQIAHLIDIWYNGLIHQVTNLPLDICGRGYDQFPALTPSVEIVEKPTFESMAGLTETVHKMAPQSYSQNVMNYTFFRILGLHVGRNFVGSIAQPVISEGKELASITERNTPTAMKATT